MFKYKKSNNHNLGLSNYITRDFMINKLLKIINSVNNTKIANKKHEKNQ